MAYILHTFKLVSMIFIVSALGTGLQAIIYPDSFAKSFGLPLTTIATDASMDSNDLTVSKLTPILVSHREVTKSYISLMGVRQLGTGIILLVFSLQNKWTEVATILAIIGIVVAGTDGIYLARSGAKKQGQWHAIPGAIIATLAGTVVYLDS